MSELVSLFDNAWVHQVLLLSARISALFLMTPVLYAIPLPALVRALLAIGLAAALALPFTATPATGFLPAGALLQAFMQEVAIGATLGLGILMPFAGFAIAGRLIDVQVGFGIGQVFDPVTRTQVPVLTSVFTLFGVLLFLLADGHHALLRGIGYSLERFPLGQPWSVQAASGPVLKQAAALFTLGFALAAPIVLSLLLVEFALGVISRNLPQMNMFVLGIPVKIIAGLLALSVWATGLGGVAGRMYGEIYRTWTAMFEQAAPAGGRR
ncbi:MAG: type secretion system inner rane protein [Ramlibacter sp.]|jgi:flagellar biosynthetic protein FliR|uniref:flagellar biosynthetic protein FliR n=1 Tax=Ramlibacter sp. TaxID=1917967 RepID=UPI0026180A14|nr:flagellar biosynthetic protein FliR [Ramlibacter sp.]MDB5752112.1 type secretion system inner rane protein [Ramlibacter sp.]